MEHIFVFKVSQIIRIKEAFGETNRQIRNSCGMLLQKIETIVSETAHRKDDRQVAFACTDEEVEYAEKALQDQYQGRMRKENADILEIFKHPAA